MGNRASSIRRTLRVPLPVQTINPEDAGPPQFLGYLSNVSETGVFVQSVNPRAVGTRLAIQLRLPGLDDRLRCRLAEIVWTRPVPGRSGAAGMGIRFLELPDPSRSTLRRFCMSGGPRGSTAATRS